MTNNPQISKALCNKSLFLSHAKTFVGPGRSLGWLSSAWWLSCPGCFNFFGPSISTYSLLHDCLSGARKSLENHTWAFHCLSLEMMCTITLAITTSHVALSNCKEYKNWEVQSFLCLEYKRNQILVDRVMSNRLLICKTSLREEFCPKLSPSLEFLSRRGSGSALWLEEILRDLFWNCIYKARNSCIDWTFISGNFGGCWWRLWVSKIPQSHLFLSSLPCHLQCPSFKCFKYDAVSMCAFGTSQNPQRAGHQWALMGREARGSGVGTHETLASTTRPFSLCWYLVPTSVSCKHQQFHTLLSQ